MKKNAKTNRQIIDEYDYLGKSCSFQDCTGLIPAGTVDENEMENYEELYPFLPKIPDGSKFKSGKDAP